MTSILFESPLPPIETPPMSVPDLIRANARELGDRPALVDANSGLTLNYAELDRQIGRVAAGLADDGLVPGEVVALISPNCVDWPVAALGVMAAGGVVTPVDPLYKGEELAHQLRDAGATRAIVFVMAVPEVRSVAEDCGVETIYVLYGDEGGTPFTELIDHDLEDLDARVEPAAVACLPYSSGTTGPAKGVELTHANIVAALKQAETVLELGTENRVMAFLPMFHIMGLSVVTLASLNAGCQLFTVPMFEPVAFLTALQEHRIDAVIAVPPVMNLLAFHPMVDDYDLSSVRLVGCGAAPLGAEIERAVAARLDCNVGQGWGMTETSGGATMPMVRGEEVDSRPGASGRLLPSCEALIIDPSTGESLGPGETGELWVRGPNVFGSYLNNPEATAATVDGAGWLHTGDLCHFDDDGYLFVTDRLKELIKVKGFQVAPAELEALLLTHPSVGDAAVIGRPHERHGEEPVAFVVRAGAVDANDLIAWVGERVADYKQLAVVEFVEAIPKNPSGKILRRELRPATVAR